MGAKVDYWRVSSGYAITAAIGYWYYKAKKIKGGGA